MSLGLSIAVEGKEYISGGNRSCNKPPCTRSAKHARSYKQANTRVHNTEHQGPLYLLSYASKLATA